MPLTDATKEAAAIEVTSLGDWISLHTDDPGTTGADEATGGSPAYSREQTTWTAGASDGVVPGSQVSFDVPAGTYTHFGVWSASSGGTFRGGDELSAPITLPVQGIILVTPTYTQS